MIIGKVGRRGQIVLPREIRERLGLQEGDRLAFVDQDFEVVLKPLKRSLLDLRGSISVSGRQNFDAIRRKVLKRAAKSES